MILSVTPAEQKTSSRLPPLTLFKANIWQQESLIRISAIVTPPPLPPPPTTVSSNSVKAGDARLQTSGSSRTICVRNSSNKVLKVQEWIKTTARWDAIDTAAHTEQIINGPIDPGPAEPDGSGGCGSGESPWKHYFALLSITWASHHK